MLSWFSLLFCHVYKHCGTYIDLPPRPLSYCVCALRRDPEPTGGAVQVSGAAVGGAHPAAAGPAGVLPPQGRDPAGVLAQPGEARRALLLQDPQLP